MAAAPTRDYHALADRLRPGVPRAAAMQAVADALWPALSTAGVSWAGFYLHSRHPDRGDELILGPRRDKPACSPIGMHGACGRCFRSGRPLIVTDVANLGDGYIACDPRDRSEVVLPLFELAAAEAGAGPCWGVLDLDSHEPGAFDARDVLGLQRVLEAAGLTARRDWRDRIDMV